MEAISDADGNFISRMSFDAFGNRRNADWTALAAPLPANTFATAWGFTGHDMVDAEGLVHMGGRVYDPALGRFLSADLYVQSPDLSQSYNRYSYTLNNPLSRIDPTGYQSCEAGEICGEVTVTGRRRRDYDENATMRGLDAMYFLRSMALFNSDWRQMAQLGGDWSQAYTETLLNYAQPMLEGGLEVVFNIKTENYGAAAGAGVVTGVEMTAGKIAKSAKVAKEGLKGQTEVVQRWMSKAELEATQKTGLLRGGRDGTHYVTDAANTDPLRTRQRLALPQTPDVRVTLEVPKGSFSPSSRVEPAFNMPGGGMERTATGNIPVQILEVY